MKLPPSVYNPTSYLGAVIAVLAAAVFAFLVILDVATGAGRAPYAGILIFIVVPAVLLFGLFLIPIGMIFERRRLKRGGESTVQRFPVFDLNDSRQRNAAVIFVVVSALLFFLTIFGSYGAYEVTESVAFCGTTCHSVMEPEYTTYLNSPHARVRCVDCHVGAGADWYVKSKLSGSYQVYSVLFDKYPRPIPAPISSLRPAQDTCEQCHWPAHFFGDRLKRFVHFLPDEQNTRWEIHLRIKTGGASAPSGQGEGIHWHMNIANRIEYIATDEKRQEIPWVRMTDLATGTVTEYASTEKPLSKEEIASAAVRTMDCMDCHNRPTHIYRSPSAALNEALQAGVIDSSLPSVKRASVELLEAEYESTEAAVAALEAGLGAYYRDNHPEVAASKRAAITAAGEELERIYRKNFFPAMKARWDVYPDNVGHFGFPGCVRCHDGLHASAGGKTIDKECDACHTISAQGTPPALEYSAGEKGLVFRHPEDIGDAWREMKCSDCHTGSIP